MSTTHHRHHRSSGHQAKVKKKKARMAKRRAEILATPGLRCWQCGLHATMECRICYRYVCDHCAVVRHKRVYCSDGCVEERVLGKEGRYVSHQAEVGRTFRMWLADPFGVNLYERVVRISLAVFFVVGLIYGLTLIINSQRQQDVRYRGVKHGVNIQDVPVGTEHRTKDLEDKIREDTLTAVGLASPNQNAEGEATAPAPE